MSGAGAQQDRPQPGPAQAACSGEGPAATAPAAGGQSAAAAARAVTAPGTGAAAGTALFVAGFSVLFASNGTRFGGLGTLLLTHQRALLEVPGGLTVLLGLLFAGAFARFPLAGRILLPSVRPCAGLAGAPPLGIMFRMGCTPCIGPTLAAVPSLAVTSGRRHAARCWRSCTGPGIGIPFLLAAALDRGMRLFSFARRPAALITQVGGARLVVAGILQASGA